MKKFVKCYLIQRVRDNNFNDTFEKTPNSIIVNIDEIIRISGVSTLIGNKLFYKVDLKNEEKSSDSFWSAYAIEEEDLEFLLKENLINYKESN